MNSEPNEKNTYNTYNQESNMRIGEFRLDEMVAEELYRLERDRNNLLCENQQFKDAIKIIMEALLDEAIPDVGGYLSAQWVRKVLGETPWKDDPTPTT